MSWPVDMLARILLALSKLGRRRRRKRPVMSRPLDTLARILLALSRLGRRKPKPAIAVEANVVTTKPARQRRTGLFKTRLLLITAVLTLGSATGVLAYFTAFGNGKGSALAGSVSAVTLSPATPSSHLYPGGSADVALTVSNPNGVSVRIVSLALDTSHGTGGFSVDGPHSGCDVSVLSFTTDSTGWTVPANAGAYPIDLTGDISMTTAAASACQGATFTVYLKAGP